MNATQLELFPLGAVTQSPDRPRPSRTVHPEEPVTEPAAQVEQLPFEQDGDVQ